MQDFTSEKQSRTYVTCRVLYARLYRTAYQVIHVSVTGDRKGCLGDLTGGIDYWAFLISVMMLFHNSISKQQTQNCNIGAIILAIYYEKMRKLQEQLNQSTNIFY